METFENLNETEIFLDEYLKNKLCFPKDKDIKIDWSQYEDELFSKEKIPQEKKRGGIPIRAHALVPRFRYVIRDSDLKVIDTVSAGILILAPLLKGDYITGVIGLINVFIQFCKKLIEKGVILEPKNFAVLMLVHKEKNGLTFDELLKKLKIIDINWTDEELNNLLNSLQNTQTRDESFVQFVKCSDNGYWISCGI